MGHLPLQSPVNVLDMRDHRDPQFLLPETTIVPSRVAQSHLCDPFILGPLAAQLVPGTNPTSLQFSLLGIPAAAQGSGCLGAAPSHFGPWCCLSPRDRWLWAASSLPSLANAMEACRNGARNLKFLQFGITRTHIHIKTTEESGSHMLLSLTL